MSDDINHLDNFDVFPWNENLETGNPLIDSQHRVLVDLLNQLARDLVVEDADEIDRAFVKLADYANKHFSDEEKIFEKHLSNHPSFESHKKVHAAFFTSVNELKLEVEDKSYKDSVEKIILFLLQWLIKHIIHSDKRLIIVINAIKSGKTVDEAMSSANTKITNLEDMVMSTLISMYNEVSSKTITLMREVEARKKAEQALEIVNKELNRLIIVDILTGLFNKRHFNNIVPMLIKKSTRERTKVSFFVLDIDYFKSINDTYGHVRGDKVLQLVGECILNLCRRPDDLAFRIGGEEFCIVASGQTQENAIDFAQTIRKSIKALKIENKNSKLDKHLTISIGLLNKIPSKDDTPDTFMKIADQRLYKAKEQRDCVVYSE